MGYLQPYTAMWKLIAEFGLDDFRDEELDLLLGTMATASVTEKSSRSLTYLFPDKATALTARRKLKTKYRAKIHCEIVPN